MITGSHANDNEIPPTIFILIKFNRMLKAIKKASKKIVFVVLKAFIGQKGKKNFIIAVFVLINS